MEVEQTGQMLESSTSILNSGQSKNKNRAWNRDLELFWRNCHLAKAFGDQHYDHLFPMLSGTSLGGFHMFMMCTIW